MSCPSQQADPNPHGLGDHRHALHEVSQAQGHDGRLKEASHGDAHGAPHAGSSTTREGMRHDQRQIRTRDDCQDEHGEQEDGESGRVEHGRIQNRMFTWEVRTT